MAKREIYWQNEKKLEQQKEKALLQNINQKADLKVEVKKPYGDPPDLIEDYDPIYLECLKAKAVDNDGPSDGDIKRTLNAQFRTKITRLQEETLAAAEQEKRLKLLESQSKPLEMDDTIQEDEGIREEPWKPNTMQSKVVQPQLEAVQSKPQSRLP